MLGPTAPYSAAPAATAPLPAAQAPLPAEQHEPPPLPPETEAPPLPPGPTKRKQYVAEPVHRPYTPPEPEALAAPAPDVAAAAAAALAAANERKRRRTERPATAAAAAARPAKLGKVSQLMNKWSAVRKDLNDEEARQQVEDEEAGDPARRREREIEEWRRAQEGSGEGADNPNFQVS